MAMVLFEYLLNGIGEVVGLNSVFLGILILSFFILFGISQRLSLFPLFILFFFIISEFSSLGSYSIYWFNSLLIFVFIILSALLTFFFVSLFGKR